MVLIISEQSKINKTSTYNFSQDYPIQILEIKKVGMLVKTLNKNKMLSFIITFVAATSANADSRDQAKRLYSSLTGNNPNKAIADKYEKLLEEKGPDAAARDIVEGNHGFYNVTLKNFFTPMSNEDGTQFAPLNDMTATLIGATRDEIDFFRVFWDNIFYQFDGELTGSSNDKLYLTELDVTVSKYNRTKNQMYIDAEKYNVPLSNKTHFKLSQQTTYTTRNEEAVAGIFSTRAWAAAYYIAGTNRASFAYFAKNFLCLEMEELNDTTIADFRVRRDVDRAPGGKTETYKTFCVGCHAGQDALGGAFAYYDYVGDATNGAMFYREHDGTDDPVAPKINRNNVYPNGKITQSDSWINLWNEGQNAYIGWGAKSSGNGVKSLGKMLSETKKVRSCLAEQVFQKVCRRAVASDEDKHLIDVLAEKFDKDSNMKNLFINTAIACSGE